MRRTFSLVDKVVVLGPSLKNGYPAFIPREKLHVIHNGVTGPAFKDDQEPNSSSPRVKRVLFLSHIKKAKGWLDFLAAARVICKTIPDVEFVFHGDAHGFEHHEIITILAEDECGGRIRYGGAVYADAKWQALKEADIFCFPSHHEAFPLVILEAMSVGLPIVATKVGSVEDAVDEGQGGYLVPPRDQQALVTMLTKLLNDPERAKQFGQHNQRRFKESFSMSAFESAWCNFLGEFAHAQPASPA
jgi:glycosyltransferase involved in cell wall biosynthesis